MLSQPQSQVECPSQTGLPRTPAFSRAWGDTFPSPHGRPLARPPRPQLPKTLKLLLRSPGTGGAALTFSSPERSGLLFSSLLNFCFLAAGMSVPAGAVDTSLSDIFLRLPPGSCRLGRGLRHTAVKHARPEPAAKLPPPPPPPLPPLSQIAPSRRGGRACDPATLLKKGRARARPPARLPGCFPCPGPGGRFSRRPLGTLHRGVGSAGSEDRVSYVPLPHQRLDTRRNSKGCSLAPFLAKTFHPQLAQSFALRPAANERKSVAWIRPPVPQREGGDKRSHLLF